MIINKQEALELAYLQKEESNLARCYIELHIELAAANQKILEQQAVIEFVYNETIKASEDTIALANIRHAVCLHHSDVLTDHVNKEVVKVLEYCDSEHNPDICSRRVWQILSERKMK